MVELQFRPQAVGVVLQKCKYYYYAPAPSYHAVMSDDYYRIIESPAVVIPFLCMTREESTQ